VHVIIYERQRSIIFATSVTWSRLPYRGGILREA
jgi:hypothetical protein